MNKKLYYKLYNGDSSITLHPAAIPDILDSQMVAYENDDNPDKELPEFVINPVWMTEEEFANLPESDDF